MSTAASRLRTNSSRRLLPGDATWSALLAVTFVSVMFLSALALRWSAAFSNVDDYLYALQTRAYLDAVGSNPLHLVDAWQQFGTNSPLIPTLALPIAAINTSPDTLVLVQIIPLWMLLLSVRSISHSLGLEARSAWIAAAIIVILPPVLDYAVMYHFAIAATACTALAAAAYLRSDRLHRFSPSVVIGTALGLLGLTRVLSPVYVVALVAPMLVDCVFDGRDRRPQLRNAGAGLAAAVIIAAPWWLTAGGRAWSYLTSAGYEDSPEGSRLGIARDRLDWTAAETGWLLAAVLTLLAVWALVCIFQRANGWRDAAWLVACASLGIALLGSSSNMGTAFALPFVALLSCAALWSLRCMSHSLRRLAVTLSGLCVLGSLLAFFGILQPASMGDKPLWHGATPGLAQARAALGCSCSPPASDGLATDVLSVIGSRPTMLSRDDAVLNAQSLRYNAEAHGSYADVALAPTGDNITRQDLAPFDFVIAGGTSAPYHPVPNQLVILSALQASGFHEAFNRRLSQSNNVSIWAAPRVFRRN